MILFLNYQVSSLGSSVESDQTFKSMVTVVGDQPLSPRSQITSLSPRKNSQSSTKVDIAVGTDDLHFPEELQTKVATSEISLTPGGSVVNSRTKDKLTSSVNIAPTITYQLHQRDLEECKSDDSGTDNSVVLTIELPTEWLQGGAKENPPKSSVVSTLYKHIGLPKVSEDSLKQNDQSPTNGENVCSNTTTNNVISDSNVTDRNFSVNRNGVDSTRQSANRRQSYRSFSNVNPMWSSTPCINTGKRKVPKLSENLNRSQIVSPKRSLFSKVEQVHNANTSMPKSYTYHSQEELDDRPLSPSSASDMDEFILPVRSKGRNSYLVRDDSFVSQDSSLMDQNYSSVLSAAESSLSLQGESIDYMKLLRLVNKPVSAKVRQCSCYVITPKVCNL